MADGSKIISYNKENLYKVSYYDPVKKQHEYTSSTSWCNTSFTISKSGKVMSWKWEGNGCRSK